MTFNVTVPNAAQSPGLFPAQNNTNNQRVKDIVNADHNFVDSFAQNQGAHKQVTLINRTVPGSLTPGTNGVLYTKDVSGVSQVFFYNGVTDNQVTPRMESSTAVITLGASATSPAILTLSDAAQVTIYVANQNFNTLYKYFIVARNNNTGSLLISQMAGTNSLNVADVVTLGVAPFTQVALRNLVASTQTFFYSMIVNRL